MSLSKRVAIALATIVPILAFAVASISSVAVADTCASRVKGDINGDGFADLVVGHPNHGLPEMDEGDDPNGALHVFFGTATGVSVEGNQFIEPRLRGVSGFLGASVTTGYFNDDCYADLAAGSTNEGKVLVAYGSPAGTDPANEQVILGDTAAGVPTLGFGTSLARGDFDGDGLDDLAVGAPNRVDGGVAVLYGGAGGFDGTRRQWFTQSTAGVPGLGEFGDKFGASLAAGDFTGDGRADLAIGIPGEAVGTTAGSGAVTVLPGSATGLTSAGRSWNQNTAGVPGVAEAQDQFGWALAAGDVNGDGKDELAIGAPGEAVGRIVQAGAITAIRFGANLAPAGFGSFHQNTPGMAGVAEANDHLAQTLVFGHFNGDGRADLGAGAPNDSVDGSARAGVVLVLYAGTTMPTTTGSVVITENTPGVPEVVDRDENFGTALTTLPQTGGVLSDLVVGVPEEQGPQCSCGGVFILRGTNTGVSGTGSSMMDPIALGRDTFAYFFFGYSVG